MLEQWLDLKHKHFLSNRNLINIYNDVTPNNFQNQAILSKFNDTSKYQSTFSPETIKHKKHIGIKN